MKGLGSGSAMSWGARCSSRVVLFDDVGICVYVYVCGPTRVVPDPTLTHAGYSHTYSFTYESYTLSLTHSLTHTLTYSLIYSHALTHTHTHSLTYSLMYPLTH